MECVGSGEYQQWEGKGVQVILVKFMSIGNDSLVFVSNLLPLIHR